MRRAVVIGMLSVVLGAAAAEAAPARRDTVRANLQAREAQPLSAGDWRRLGDGVEALLDEAFRDRSLLLAHRARALGALAKVGGPRAQRTLAAVLADPKTPPALLAVAVEAHAAYLGAAQPAAALAHGKRLLAHEDWLVRQAAARALGRLATAEARAALSAHAPAEPHAAVRAAIAEALK